MVKELLKELFITNNFTEPGFPSVVELLPAQLQDTYAQYYSIGSGRVLIYLMIAIFIIEAAVGAKWEKIVARTALILIAYFYAATTAQLRNTSFLLNQLGLPIINLSTTLLYICLSLLGLLAFISFRSKLHLLVRKSIIHAVDFTIIVLLVFFLLPVYSGEL